VGEAQSFDLSYLEGADKRLDLYFILDLSATMVDDRVSVRSASGSNFNSFE
jgi:hypothetical protein